jgi:cytochrome P450
MVRRATNRIVRVVPTTKEGEMTTTKPLTIHRYPIAGVCAVLGVPRKDWHLFRRWAGESLNSKSLDELNAYVDVMIADRCTKPGDDLLSKLIQLEVDGEELTVDDLRMVVAALVTGGSD